MRKPKPMPDIKTIEELEEFFDKNPITNGFEVSKVGIISDYQKFLESHFEMVKSGNDIRGVYFERLLKVRTEIINNNNK